MAPNHLGYTPPATTNATAAPEHTRTNESVQQLSPIKAVLGAGA
jgi:hypothetical protein